MNPRYEEPHEDRAAVERARVDFLVKRDGIAGATRWVGRTIGIYRRAVLNRHHHASREEYRRRFIQSYCALKAWFACLADSSKPIHSPPSHE